MSGNFSEIPKMQTKMSDLGCEELIKEYENIQDSRSEREISPVFETQWEPSVYPASDLTEAPNMTDNWYGHDRPELLKNCYDGNSAIVSKLVKESGLDINFQDEEYGDTPALLASERG